MLYRLATTTHWYECETKFGMYSSKMSVIFWEQAELLNSKYGNLLELRILMLRERSEICATAIVDAGVTLDSCVGFIDGARIVISRPGGSYIQKRSCFSGHKRFHCLMFRTPNTPDDLIFSMFGNLEVRRHDMTLLHRSGWNTSLDGNHLLNCRQFYIYGNSAHSLKPWIQKPLAGCPSDEKRKFNIGMSAARVLRPKTIFSLFL